jgi:hypothetical protein
VALGVDLRAGCGRADGGELIGGFEVEHLHGLAEIPYGDDELVVVCLVRDGEPWVSTFVEHYFSLGAKHLVFLDNNSTDGTVAAASGHDGVTVLRTALPFGADVEGTGGQVVMRQYLIERFGRGRWSLCVDVDELFDYPYSDVIGLDSLLSYLNSKSYTAVMAQMLDMFPERPLLELAGEPDEPLKEVHRFYDISGLERMDSKKRAWNLSRDNNTLESDEIEWFAGGLRRRVFDLPGPWLTKYPLVFCDGTLEPKPPHGVRNARIADLTCVLCHYKFLRHFREQVVQAVREQQYHRKSRAYKKYLETLEKNPGLRLKQETSVEIKSVNELLDNRFLIASEDYVRWVDAEEERRFAGAGLDGPGASVEELLRSKRGERARTLRIGRLEQRLLGHQQQDEAKTRRIGTLQRMLRVRTQKTQELQRQLSARTEEAQKLGRQLLGLEQKAVELEEELRHRVSRLRRLKQRTQRLTQQNDRLKQQIRDLEASRAWRFLSIIHSGKMRLKGLLPPRQG